jgi:hypothetical protein
MGVVDHLLDAIGLSRPSILSNAQNDPNVAATRAALGEATFAAAWAEGRAMPLEQAVGYALAKDS